MGSIANLLAAGAGSTIIYTLLVFTSAMVAMLSKKKVRRDMAWKVFSALIRRRLEPPALPPAPEDKRPKQS